MELWYSEQYPNVDARLSFKTTDVLHRERSQFQQIDVIETEHFGRIMLIDGLVMLTDRDEFIYHEMISHVPVNVHPNPQSVLVIGGGDGGTVRELCKHPEVKHVDLVDIDERVAAVSKDYFPAIAAGFEDDRVHTHWQDGVDFIKRNERVYDIIIIDSTDPFGPGEGLFTTDFYTDCREALSPNGILVNQSESPQWTPDYVRGIYQKLSTLFPVFRFYQAHIPTYPSGHWLFGFASKTLDPVDDQKPNRWHEKGIHTRYYNTAIHPASFAMPNFVNELCTNATESDQA